MGNNMEDGLDAEGKAILDELEKEGNTIAGREPAVVEPPAVVEAPKVEPAPTDPPPKADKPKVEPPKIEDNKGKEPAPDRKVQHVPLPKYLDTEKNLKEALLKIEELTKAKPGEKPTEAVITDATGAVKELVDKFGYEEEDAKRMLDVIKHLIPGQTISPEMQRALDALPLLDQMKADLEKKQDAALFDTDFASKVIKEFPHLDKYKDQIKEMAYTEAYAKTPLRAVALEFMHQEGISQTAADVHTADKGGGGSNKGASEIDFAHITEEQFSKLSPEQQDKFFEFQEKREKEARGSLN